MDENVQRLLDREGTGISWAHLTFNPWLGCQKTGSPACEHCYAETFVEGRLGALGVRWGPGQERRKTAKGTWQKIARWQRIAAAAGVTLNVFSGSLCDIFDNAVPDEWRIQLGAEIIASPNLRWMLLTKRIGNARKMLEAMFPEGVPANVALGVTICNQTEADRDMPKALAVKKALGVHRLFLSGEPLMGCLDLLPYLPALDLVIVGGESGKDARSMPDYWPRAIRNQCAAMRTPFHFKQLSQADHPGTYNKPDTFHPEFQIREHFE